MDDITGPGLKSEYGGWDKGKGATRRAALHKFVDREAAPRKLTGYRGGWVKTKGPGESTVYSQPAGALLRSGAYRWTPSIPQYSKPVTEKSHRGLDKGYRGVYKNGKLVSQTKFIPGKTTQWKGYVNQYIPDPTTGGYKENPAFKTGMSGKDPVTGKRITYSQTYTGAVPLSRAALANKMPTDSEYLAAKASTDTTYNSDVNQRQRNLDMTNLDYGQNQAKLVQSRVRDLAGIDNRAARLGVGFSQGRFTARDNYDTNFNDNAQRAQSANTIANAQFLNQNVDAQANRVDAMRTTGLNVVRRLQTEDAQNVLTNPGLRYGNTTAQKQYYDRSGQPTNKKPAVKK